MHKLRLDLDDLTVDSFDTGAEADRLGTVRANQELEVGDAIVAPAPVSWNTDCRSICFTCYDPTCDSCYATGCRTRNTPECCA
jgi:hypothetical protein